MYVVLLNLRNVMAWESPISLFWSFEITDIGLRRDKF